jgi:hypothetical protein
VNDEARAQPAATGRDGFAGLAASLPRDDGAALVQDLRPACPMDRAVHTSSAEERGVRRVHDAVDVLGGDVADGDLHAGAGQLGGAHGARRIPGGPPRARATLAT